MSWPLRADGAGAPPPKPPKSPKSHSVPNAPSPRRMLSRMSAQLPKPPAPPPKMSPDVHGAAAPTLGDLVLVRRAVLVVKLALLVVRQHLVGFVDLLELRLVAARVGVVLARELARTPSLSHRPSPCVERRASCSSRESPPCSHHLSRFSYAARAGPRPPLPVSRLLLNLRRASQVSEGACGARIRRIAKATRTSHGPRTVRRPGASVAAASARSGGRQVAGTYSRSYRLLSRASGRRWSRSPWRAARLSIPSCNLSGTPRPPSRRARSHRPPWPRPAPRARRTPRPCGSMTSTPSFFSTSTSLVCTAFTPSSSPASPLFVA